MSSTFFCPRRAIYVDSLLHRSCHAVINFFCNCSSVLSPLRGTSESLDLRPRIRDSPTKALESIPSTLRLFHCRKFEGKPHEHSLPSLPFCRSVHACHVVGSEMEVGSLCANPGNFTSHGRHWTFFETVEGYLLNFHNTKRI